ncbi:MAG TPA: class I SAM-dependent methyltransferase [Thermoanaerobaculia bacterium]
MRHPFLRRLARAALARTLSPEDIVAVIPWERIGGPRDSEDLARAAGTMLEKLSSDVVADHLYEKLTAGPTESGWTAQMAALHERWRPRGLQVLPEHFYTPVFDPERLTDSVWSARFETGVRYDAGEQLSLWRRVHRFGDELAAFPEDPDGLPDEARRFFWRNSEFSHQDAVLYYSLIRHLRPARVIEVGGGFSTLLAAEAAARNGQTRIDCIEPYPRPFLATEIPGVRLHAASVLEVPLDFFRDLADGDILFIDCSHVSKTGSDVNHLLLRVVPSLRSGVWVHVHDIFLPFEYPREWPLQRLYFNEQYVLAGLLANSAALEVMIANYFLMRVAPAALREFSVPGRNVSLGGASFWMRTRPAGAMAE